MSPNSRKKYDIDRVVELYLAGHSLPVIAEIIGCCHATVWNYLRSRGIKCRAVGACASWAVEDLKREVPLVTHIDELADRLKIPKTRGFFIRIRRELQLNKIDTSHWKRKASGRPKGSKNFTDEEIFCKNSRTENSTVKRRGLELGILKNYCSICGLPPQWRGTPLNLMLDHIDGDRHNNEPTNLRLICYNCNSQLDTFTGRNKKKYQLAA